MPIKNEPKIKTNHVEDIRSAIEHRATWFYFLLDDARKKGLDGDDFARKAIFRTGCFHGDVNFTNTSDLRRFAEEFVKAYEHQIVESLRENRGNTGLPKVKLEPLDEEKYKAEQAAKQAANDDSGELEDQTEPAYQTGPVETLEDIEHLDELDELIDFDDLEERLEADPDDSDQAKA